MNVVATNGDAADYEHYWTAYRESPTPKEQYRYLFALPLFRDAELFERTLEATFGDDIRSQDAPFVFAYSLINRDLAIARGRSSRNAGTRPRSGSRHELTIRLVEGVRYLTLPEQVNEAQCVLRRAPDPAVGQDARADARAQRVAAALRERATPHLEAHFSG